VDKIWETAKFFWNAAIQTVVVHVPASHNHVSVSVLVIEILEGEALHFNWHHVRVNALTQFCYKTKKTIRLNVRGYFLQLHKEEFRNLLCYTSAV
jgi:hypothetical protein